MATDARVLKLALQILNESRKAWAEYEEECKAYRAEGFTPHYCFHGTNRWTDYDNICGWCEDYGNSWNFQVAAQEALGKASRAVEEESKRLQMVIDMMKAQAPITITEELSNWVKEPTARYEK